MHKFINGLFGSYAVEGRLGMESARTVEGQLQNNHEKMMKLVKLLEEIGPDIAEISRRMGEHKETVRYWYKEKILGKGFAITANPNYGALGLRRVMAIVEFPPNFGQMSNSILIGLNQLGYLTYFSKTLPGRKYITDWSVPLEHLDLYYEFLRELREMGVFSNLQIFPFEWVRGCPMKTENYDFETGNWDFDWSKNKHFEIHDLGLTSRATYDYTDLFIIKELQMDPNKSLATISKTHSMNYKTLVWHYVKHVKANNLIKSFWINWLGTRYDPQSERALHRQHRFLLTSLLVKNVSQYENIDISTKLNLMPFIYFEAGGENYSAEFAFPLEIVNEAFQYLDDVLEPYYDKFELYTIDSTNALTFTIPYHMYDQETRKWKFNKDEIIQKFANLITKIKEVRWEQ